MFNNIPAELRALPQWLLWKYEIIEGRETKIPCTPSGRLASVTDPATWVDFNIACHAAKHFNGIGFVLTANDPYTIIDLDNKPDNPCTPEQLARHTKIYEMFDSYAERSTSGTGAHIIVRGKIPAGVRRDNVEVYFSSRYMVCTGDVLRGGPIKDCQPLLDILYAEMQREVKTVELEEVGDLLDDAEIVDKASRAVNGDKFNSLCSGNMDGYPSQSEADFALLSILAFYTKSNEQVRRIFRMSKLGKREKANRNNTYLDFALGKIRGNAPEPIDLTQLAANAAAIAANFEKNLSKPPEQLKETPETIKSDVTLPPGLVGEIAQHFYSSSIRPVIEVSLIAAIACVAGIVGRTYNISNQGLAQYMILLARTGTGKEAASSGISKLFHAVNEMNPLLNVNQYLGPAVFASGPALHRVLSEKPCFVSVLGEFGYTVQRLSSPRANSAELTLKQLILDSYGKSGHGQVLQPSVYSDKDKNISPVASPNITILGESTPESFYDGLDQSHIASGFLSRFLIFEYLGDRPDMNENFNCPPSQELKQKLADLVVIVGNCERNKTIVQVQQLPEAMEILKAFNRMVDTKIRGANDSQREIWNRAHLKALKLAGVIAVGVNAHDPCITPEIANWAINIVQMDCQAIQKRFASGDIGVGDSKQINDLRRAIENYTTLTFEEAKKFGTTVKMFADGVIPYQYFMKKTNQLAAFRNDKLGSTLSLKRTLQALVDAGMLKLIPKVQSEQAYQYTGDAYGISKHW